MRFLLLFYLHAIFWPACHVYCQMWCCKRKSQHWPKLQEGLGIYRVQKQKPNECLLYISSRLNTKYDGNGSLVRHLCSTLLYRLHHQGEAWWKLRNSRTLTQNPNPKPKPYMEPRDKERWSSQHLLLMHTKNGIQSCCHLSIFIAPSR